MADGLIDNARKVLAAERRAGCHDTVVVGGLERFLANWRNRVGAGADDPSLLLLAEQVVATLEGYAAAPPDDRGRRLDRALELLETGAGDLDGRSPASTPAASDGRLGIMNPVGGGGGGGVGGGGGGG
jgi:hypothetical protein